LPATSDDPEMPVKIVEALAYTIWRECGCKQCCHECRKGQCGKRHSDCCVRRCAEECRDEELIED
jgi:hypothetical protein